MRFTYTYRSSDGQRHTAEIEAESRDAAFAKVRAELGIKPIKVVAAEEPPPQMTPKRVPSRVLLVACIVLFAAVGVAVVAYRFGTRRNGDSGENMIVINTPQGPVTSRMAEPLPRQPIPGDRVRIEKARDTTFTNAAERLLSRFAEPGRTVAALPAESPTEAEFAACLRETIRTASTDFTEVVDLKRIVAGMKREMRAYLAGGGTAEQYLSELAKRQKLEVSYRENAEKRLEGMLSKPKEAYAYWLKANASLKSMGIYELPLPPALHGYQAGLDLDE